MPNVATGAESASNGGDTELATPARCGCLLCQGLGDGALPSTPSAAGGINTGVSYINALLAGQSYRWNSAQAMGSSATVTYSFMSAVPSYYSAGASERSNFIALTAQQQQGVRDALAMYADVANITFTEVADSGAGGQIRVGTAMLPSGVGAWAYYPNQGSIGGDTWLSNRYANNLNMTKGTYGYLTVMHELGHALGLKHPGNYNASGGGTEGPYLPSSTDSHLYTVMSYRSNSNISIYPQSLMLYDIAAIQYLYGANTNTRSGNTSYSWSANQEFVQTIWDGGGTDTIDASNQTRRSIINLGAGTFSSIGQKTGNVNATNNLSIAFGVVIENAIGGSGNDEITGNSANNSLTANGGSDTVRSLAGDDSIDGGAGDDLLNGGDGNDTILGGSGNDRIFGGAGNDTLMPGAGTDIVAGGSGTDSVVFSGTRAQHTVTTSGAVTTVVGPFGTTTLRDVESLQFDDQTQSITATRVVPNDFDGDGKADIVWRNANSGAMALWQMDGSTVDSTGAMQVGGANASVPGTVAMLGTNDFTGDGKADILWRNTRTGGIAMWEMNGATSTWTGSVSVAGAPAIVPTTIAVAGIADFTGDGKADVLWRNQNTGGLSMWEMDGHTVTSSGSLLLNGANASVPVSVRVEAFTDMTGDGLADILWRNPTNGALAVWELEGRTVVNTLNVTNGGSAASVATSVAVEAVRDFNGDGSADILWRNTRSGALAMWEMNGSAVSSVTTVQLGGAAAVVPMSVAVASAEDFDGDGGADILWRNTRTGALSLWTMNGNTVSSSGAVSVGGGGIVPTSITLEHSSSVVG